MQTFHPKNYVLVLCLSTYAVLPHALHADPTTAPTVALRAEMMPSSGASTRDCDRRTAWDS